ncbi:MAG TPA: NUDIX domain-containing protein [Solirubrobacteraceae bacterium]|nr:NUDIX domain-containing protein [Solirubrobacteraceae bacterium]
MARRRSAGLLLYRQHPGAEVEVLLAHIGGPFWSQRDAGGWSLPKGEHGAGEEPLAAARREFTEELGLAVPPGDPVYLGEIRQSHGKLIRAWALMADLDVSEIVSNTFEIEWPPRSGRMQRFPEVDRAGWFDLRTARIKLTKSQVPFIDLLTEHLRRRPAEAPSYP